MRVVRSVVIAKGRKGSGLKAVALGEIGLLVKLCLSVIGFVFE